MILNFFLGHSVYLMVRRQKDIPLTNRLDNLLSIFLHSIKEILQ